MTCCANKVFEMLGIKKNEKFKLKHRYTGVTLKNDFFLTETLTLFAASEAERFRTDYDIADILIGDLIILKQPFIPKRGETYYFFENGNTYSLEWNDSDFDLMHWKIKDCFRTREEAETIGKELMKNIEKEYNGVIKNG